MNLIEILLINFAAKYSPKCCHLPWNISAKFQSELLHHLKCYKFNGNFCLFKNKICFGIKILIFCLKFCWYILRIIWYFSQFFTYFFASGSTVFFSFHGCVKFCGHEIFISLVRSKKQPKVNICALFVFVIYLDRL